MRVVPAVERIARRIRRRGTQGGAGLAGRRGMRFRRDQAETASNRQDDHRADDQDSRIFHNVLHGTARRLCQFGHASSVMPGAVVISGMRGLCRPAPSGPRVGGMGRRAGARRARQAQAAETCRAPPSYRGQGRQALVIIASGKWSPDRSRVVKGSVHHRPRAVKAALACNHRYVRRGLADEE